MAFAKQRQDLVAILDIGSSKIACFIARMHADGRLVVEGIGHQLSSGVRSGLVTDIDAAEEAICAAVHAAEQMAGEQIDSVVVNISGSALRSHHLHIQLPLQHQAVTGRDIMRLVEHGKQTVKGDEREVIHAIPISYTIDDARGISNPQGMYGHELGTDLHLITAPESLLKNMTHCLARAQLDVQEWVVSSYASGLACLSHDEMELGATLVDIGGGTTSVSVFVDGKPIFTDAIPLGGVHVTNDIARGLSTSIATAERIKALYGGVYASPSEGQEMIEVPLVGVHEDEPGADVQSIPRSMLAGIIRPRMEEIFEMVRLRLDESGFDRVAGRRMVITGGTSQLVGVKELAAQSFKKQVRLGRPQPFEGLAESTAGNAFATGIGMLELLARRMRKEQALRAHLASDLKNPVSRALQWFRERL
jgi:cell division protein FtsA